MRILLTGSCGFIGHHVTGQLLRDGHEVVALDRVDATSTLERFKYIDSWEDVQGRMKFVWHDLRAPVNEMVGKQIGSVDAIIHLAASTHVDRSIQGPVGFVYDNVLGTAHLLEWARKQKGLLGVAVQSTDEVYGPAPTGVAYKEWDRYKSSNPYSATKAGAAELAIAYANTYQLPVLCLQLMNVVGVRQHHEKFVPKVIGHVMTDRLLHLHADAATKKPGSRCYIHASNVAAVYSQLMKSWDTPSDGPTAAALERRLDLWKGDKLNIPGEVEIDNLEMAQRIATIIGQSLRYELVDYHADRPGHDLRYALDGAKLRGLGITYPYSLEADLPDIVRWYVKHSDWLDLTTGVIRVPVGLV